MIENIVFSRKTAVNEGLRASVELNRDSFKRPFLKFMRVKPYNEVRDSISRMYSTTPSNLKMGGASLLSYLKDDVEKFAMFSKYNSNIILEDAVASEGFKKKSMYVYVEKQHNNVYTLRCLNKNIPTFADINLGDFYDIAGRSVLINLTKSKGLYKINKMIKVLQD